MVPLMLRRGEKKLVTHGVQQMLCSTGYYGCAVCGF